MSRDSGIPVHTGWFGLRRPSSSRALAGGRRLPRRRPCEFLDLLEERTLLSTITLDIAGGALSYAETGTPGSGSVLTVSTTGKAGSYTFSESTQPITLGPGAVLAGWTGSGTDTVTGPDSSVTSIAITKLGQDNINIESVDASTVVDAGSGTTSVHVGNAGSLAGIQAAITARSTGGSGVLSVDDSSNSASRTFSVTSTQVNGNALADPITFGTGISNVTIKGGTGDDTFNVSSFGTGSLSSYNLQGGTGTNTLNVTSTLAGLTFTNPGQIVASPSLILNYANLASVHITEPATAPSGTAATIKGVEGTPVNNQVVATFTDSDLGVTPTDFAASINWGDSTAASSGQIVSTGPGAFEVLGSHTFAATGTFPVNVTLSALGATGSTTVGGTTIVVTTTGPVASTPSPIVSSATVAAAPLSAQGAPIAGYQGLPLSDYPVVSSPSADVLVATFTDTGTIGTPADYTASINWGDGSAATSATRIVSAGTANGTVFSVYGDHTYAGLGPYQVVTTITKTASGAQAVATSQATIVDAPLSGTTTPTLSVTEGMYFTGTLALLTDTNPSSSPDHFRIMIDWGDGSPESAGILVASPSSGGSGVSYAVDGSHTYADSLPTGAPGTGLPGPQTGNYLIHVYITETGGATLNLTNNALVTDRALTLTGKLNPSSDSGISNSDNITNVVQPNFIGTTSEPDATVSLYATAAGSSSPVLLGTTRSDSSDAWSITSSMALSDGSYAITAQATDSSGHTISNMTTIVSSLVIDTVGPKVTNIYFDRIHGQVQITFQDFGGVGNAGVGMNQSTVVDANNYAFSLIYSPFNPKRVPRFLVTSITVSPGTQTGAQAATVVINHNRYLRGGHFLFTARSVSPTNLTGIQDIAGNALDGEFYSYFPSGNNHPGGDFVAEIDAEHHKVYAPRSVIGSATPVSPPGTPGTSSHIPTYQPGRSRYGTAAVKLASKQVVNTTPRATATPVARASLAHVRRELPARRR